MGGRGGAWREGGCGGSTVLLGVGDNRTRRGRGETHRQDKGRGVKQGQGEERGVKHTDKTRRELVVQSAWFAQSGCVKDGEREGKGGKGGKEGGTRVSDLRLIYD